MIRQRLRCKERHRTHDVHGPQMCDGGWRRDSCHRRPRTIRRRRRDCARNAISVTIEQRKTQNVSRTAKLWHWKQVGDREWGKVIWPGMWHRLPAREGRRVRNLRCKSARARGLPVGLPEHKGLAVSPAARGRRSSSSVGVRCRKDVVGHATR
jgi:hypothetical protein